MNSHKEAERTTRHHTFLPPSCALAERDRTLLRPNAHHARACKVGADNADGAGERRLHARREPTSICVGLRRGASPVR